MSEANEQAAARRRRRRRNNSLLILITGILLFGVAAGTLYYALRPETLRIAVGPPGSDDVKLIQTLSHALSREGSPVRLAVITTEGATESVAQVVEDKADLAVTRADLKLPANATSVAVLRKNVVVLWAPSGTGTKGAKKLPASKVKSLNDLAGRRVGVIGKTQANIVLLRVLLTEAGVNPDKVTIAQFGTNQIAEMAHDATLDAYMTVGPLNSKITADAIAQSAAARGEPKFLPVDVADAIAQRHPHYEPEEIAGSIFSSSPARPEDTVETVGVNHLIIAPRTLSDTAVGSFVRQLFTVRQQVATEVPSAAKIEKPDTDKDAALPAHPGAAAYIDGTERTFLEKYTDYVWGAILLLSGLGSAGAWLRHYFSRNERERYVAHRDTLLELIARVRRAETADELTAMQCEADNMLREALDLHEDGAIEEDELSVIGLTLEQFHHAVTDRRAAIGAAPANLPRVRAS